MNLEEIGSFKNKVISKLINDDNILDVLLGDIDDVEDPETALLGKDGSGKGGCVFKYEFVPDTQENSKTFLCVEVVPEETNGDTITDMTIYVFAYCSKNLMQTYRRKAYRVEGSIPYKTEDDVIIEAHPIWYKAVPQAGFELSWQNTGDPVSLTMTFDVLADADGNMFDLVFDGE